MTVIADTGTSNDVNLYDSEIDRWSTAQLSVKRYHLAATSVGNLAIFAGGYSGNRCVAF
jgi:hypothetical protein